MVTTRTATESASRNRDLENLVLQFHSVYELVRRTGAVHEPDRIYTEIVSGIHLELAYERVAVWKWHPESHGFVGVHGVGVPEGLVQSLLIPFEAAMPLVRRSIEEGRDIQAVRGEGEPLAAEIYSGLAEDPAECLILPILSRGQNRCYQIRRDPAGCPKAEAGPAGWSALRMSEEDTHRCCPVCPVFPVAGFLWADRGRTGRPIGEDLLPLWFFLAQTDLRLEAVTLYEQLRESSTRDPLTGIHNRAHFYSVLGLEVERAQRYGHETSLVMIDLDGFKRINDRHGHIAGDRILAGTADQIRRVLRRHDLLARYGGDEFVLVLPHTAAAEAARVVERIREGTAGDPTSPEEPSVRFSAGIATAPRFADTAEALVHLADYEMYRAKQAGGGRTSIFGE